MVTGLVLLLASVRTVAEAASGPHAKPHIVILGAVEAMSALLFLWPRTMRPGAIGLLISIGVAFLVHALIGQFRGDLVIFAAAVVFVSVRGSLTDPQWRALV
jgi:hypothetical protein